LGSDSRSASSTGSACWPVAALLGYEHSLVRQGDLRRLDAAFFTVNGVISIVFFAFVFADVLL
jgi:4-hydroxybenzoate polyprenyltransferase